ncbi:MAG: hypothetical protein U5K79_17875 [Cyclobacteriaceae bacterium]|nr:hypothetical protein [Cyclobacteriaceae bacterium]
MNYQIALHLANTSWKVSLPLAFDSSCAWPTIGITVPTANQAVKKNIGRPAKGKFVVYCAGRAIVAESREKRARTDNLMSKKMKNGAQ